MYRMFLAATVAALLAGGSAMADSSADQMMGSDSPVVKTGSSTVEGTTTTITVKPAYSTRIWGAGDIIDKGGVDVEYQGDPGMTTHIVLDGTDPSVRPELPSRQGTGAVAVNDGFCTNTLGWNDDGDRVIKASKWTLKAPPKAVQVQAQQSWYFSQAYCDSLVGKQAS